MLGVVHRMSALIRLWFSKKRFPFSPFGNQRTNFQSNLEKPLFFSRSGGLGPTAIQDGTHVWGLSAAASALSTGLALTLAFTTFATAFALVVFALCLSWTTRRSVSIVLAATSFGPSSCSLSFPFALDVADAICEYSLWCIVLAKFLADNLEEDMRDHETTVGMAHSYWNWHPVIHASLHCWPRWATTRARFWNLHWGAWCRDTCFCPFCHPYVSIAVPLCQWTSPRSHPFCPERLDSAKPGEAHQ